VGEWETSAFIQCHTNLLFKTSHSLTHTHTHSLNYTFSSHSTKKFVVFFVHGTKKPHRTEQVFQNTIHVTIAGVVSTWWFAPQDANSFCSLAIKDSFVRATTTSFGSICFGSLLVAIVETLKALVENVRQDSERDGCEAFLLCIVDCLLGCLEDMLEYFNKFAYIYVGMVRTITFMLLLHLCTLLTTIYYEFTMDLSAYYILLCRHTYSL